MKRLAAWLPAVAWAASIFFVSAKPGVPVPPLFPGLDKVLHFGAYGLLGLLIGFAAGHSGMSMRMAALLGMLYGASDEFHQSLVPGRSPDVWDWVADAAGVMVAVFLYSRWRARGGAASPDARPGPAPFSGA